MGLIFQAEHKETRERELIRRIDVLRPVSRKYVCIRARGCLHAAERTDTSDQFEWRMLRSVRLLNDVSWFKMPRV